LSRSFTPEPDLVLRRLAAEYGFPRHGNPKDAFYCAVYVLLSAQTTLEQASLALKLLRRRWPTPKALSRARPEAIRRAVHSCGFGDTRTTKIRALARAVARRERSLRVLRNLPDQELEAELVALPGIGFKSARVVAAMSSFERDRFAIDTHVWRIAQRLGWIPKRRTDRKPTERQADELEAQIPAGSRRQLHACLVALGRKHCRPLQPRCSACVLNNICAHAAKREDARRRHG
jgi:endonuclease III